MRGDAAGGILLFLFGGVTVVLSLSMPLGSLRMAGPGMFPLALGILLMLLSGIWVLRCLLQGHAGSKGLSLSPVLRNVLPFVLAMAMYVLLLDTLGYPFTSLLLLLALFRLMGSRAWALNLAIALGVAGCSFLVFVSWLQVPLPRGLLGL